MAQKKDEAAWGEQPKKMLQHQAEALALGHKPGAPPPAPAGVYVPKKKLGPDVGIRLGRKITLKPKLEAIAVRNGLTLNDLVIYIFEWYLAERGHGREFSVKIK